MTTPAIATITTLDDDPVVASTAATRLSPEEVALTAEAVNHETVAALRVDRAALRTEIAKLKAKIAKAPDRLTALLVAQENVLLEVTSRRFFACPGCKNETKVSLLLNTELEKVRPCVSCRKVSFRPSEHIVERTRTMTLEMLLGDLEEMPAMDQAKYLIGVAHGEIAFELRCFECEQLKQECRCPEGLS